MTTEDKIDVILDNQKSLTVLLARIETDLRHHIKRSDQHEIQLMDQNKTISRLWLAVALLAGGGLGTAAPSLFKIIGGIL